MTMGSSSLPNRGSVPLKLVKCIEYRTVTKRGDVVMSCLKTTSITILFDTMTLMNVSNVHGSLENVLELTTDFKFNRMDQKKQFVGMHD